MGAIEDVLQGMANQSGGDSKAKPTNKTASKKVQLDDVTNVIGALSGNKQDKMDLMDRAKDLIPGTLDDTVIDVLKQTMKSKKTK